MLIHFFFLIGVKSFEEKNFDLDLTEMTADIESGTTKRVRRAFAHGTITTVDCSRGLDQASSNEPKYLVFPDFPEKMYKPIKCIWSINASPGTYIQVNIKELILPCAGGNKLLIQDGKTNSKAICGKIPPMITSTEPQLGFHLMLNKPGPHGARVQIGFMQKDSRQGWTVAEFNKGKKAPAPKAADDRLDRSGHLKRKPGTAPKRRAPPTVLKSAGQAPQVSKQGPQAGPAGPPRGSPPRGPPSKKHGHGPPPKQEKYDGDTRQNFRHTTKHGTADRWEVIDRRPILIGGGCIFLLFILGVAFYVGKIMKKDQVEQDKLAAENKEKPRFKIPDPVEVIIDQKPATESFNNTEITSAEKPLTEKPDKPDK